MNQSSQTSSQYSHKPNPFIRLFLGGDVMTGRAIDQLFPVHNPEDFGKPDHLPARQYLAWSTERHGAELIPVRHDYIWGSALGMLDRFDPDFRLVNLELAITTSNTWAQKSFNFRMHPANTPSLSAAGLDCCALANNHLLDFGAQGLTETLKALSDAGIGYAGAGADCHEAQRPHIHILPEGARLLVFSWAGRDSGVSAQWEAGPNIPGVNFLPDYSEATARRMVEQMRAFRNPGDITIASIHWGGNWVKTIPEAHRWLAHYLVEQGGVDLIHGHSSHHPIGIEEFQGKLILYGCGDLINDYEGHPKYRAMRHHLGALYFADLHVDTGNLRGLRVLPVQRRRFRLENPSPEDAAWVINQIKHGCDRT